MKLVETEVQNLKESPRIHTEIEKFDELDRRYRRIVVKKYKKTLANNTNLL